MASDVKRLLDQFGEPIAPGALRAQISPPGSIHARPPFDGHLAFGIDPGRLGALIRASDSGNSRDWMILAEEIEELFPHYYAVLSKRKRQVAQLPVTVKAADVPGGEKHADLVRDWLDDGVLARAMFDVLDGIGKGFSVHEIVWDTAPGRVRPAELCYRPPRHFELSWKDGETVWLRTEAGFQDLAPHKFLLHAHRSKSGLATRGGLTRAVAFLWLYASYTLKDWALFSQGYGLPIRLGRYGPEASENDKRVLWRAVSSIAGDVAAMIPKTMEMEFVQPANTAGGTELFLKRSDWLNLEVSKLVLGSTAGTDAQRGSYGAGAAHREVETDVERFDAFLVETSIARQIVQTMVAFTFGPQDAYPKVSIGRPDEVPLKDVIAGVADLGGMGLRVRASELRDRMQLSAPEDGDEVVGGVPPAPVPKPVIPSPAVTPAENSAGAVLGGRLRTLLARHVREIDPDLVDALVDRLAQDAQGALHGLSQQVRREIEAASDMHDLVARMHRLKLDPEMFALAMQRGLAVAQLVGQASLLDEIGAELHARHSRA
jgi:phage gp29-like protein